MRTTEIALRIGAIRNKYCPYDTVAGLLELADEARSLVPDEVKSFEVKAPLKTIDQFEAWRDRVLIHAEDAVEKLKLRSERKAAPSEYIDIDVVFSHFDPARQDGVFAAMCFSTQSGRRMWLFADRSKDVLVLPVLKSEVRNMFEKLAQGRPAHNEPLQTYFGALAFLEAFVSDEADVNDLSQANTAIWGALEVVCRGELYVEQMLLGALSNEKKSLARRHRFFKALSAVLGAAFAACFVGSLWSIGSC